MSLIIRKPWLQKPPPGTPLDWSHPLAQGLRVCFACNEGAGLPKELTQSGYSGDATGSPGRYSWVQGGIQNTPWYGIGASGSKVSATGCSSLLSFGMTSRPLNSGSFVAPYNFNYSVGSFTILSQGNIGYTVRDGGGNPYYSPSASYNVNIPYCFAGSFGPNAVSLASKGVFIGTGSGTPSPYTVSTFNATLCAGDQYVDTSFALYWWSRCLSPAELCSISANPWQIFQPQKRNWALFPAKPITYVNNTTNTGYAILDFGKGSQQASVTVQGQSTIASNSFVEAWKAMDVTTDHGLQDILVSNFEVLCSAPTGGSGFTITGTSRMGNLTGKYRVNWSWV